MADYILNEKQITAIQNTEIGSLVNLESIDRLWEIVAIGDVVSETLWSNGIIPRISIYDGKTKRKEYTEFKSRIDSLPSEDVIHITAVNPHSTICDDMAYAILYATERSLFDKRPIVIEVDGEEDLAVVQAMRYSPNGRFIVFGQPNVGMRMIKVNIENREFIESLLKTSGNRSDNSMKVAGME